MPFGGETMILQTGLLAVGLMLFSCPSECRLIVDLTHTYDKDVPKYPLTSFGVTNFTYFNHWTLSDSYHDQDNNSYRMWLSLKYLEFYEHQGTHMDAPFHFSYMGQKLHEVPPERLIGPGIVIDVKEKARANPNYGVTLDDLLDFEGKYGTIPRGAIVVMNSGWDKKYPDPQAVFGTPTPENTTTFNFPGFHLDACKFLLEERQVSVVGVDTPSVDPGKPTMDPYGFSYPCHMYLQPAQVPLLEYVAHLDAIPKYGTTLFLGAIKTRDGSGGPCRIFAIIEPGPCDDTTSGARTNSFVVFSLIIFTLCALLDSLF